MSVTFPATFLPATTTSLTGVPAFWGFPHGVGGMVGQSKRFLLDATTVRGGGGFTFAVNVVPQLARLAPNDLFRVMVRSEHLAEALPELPNLEVERLPEAGLASRFRFTFFEAPRRAAAWGADLYYSTADYAPPRAPCPVIASCQNLNVFEIRRDWELSQQFRLRVLRALAQLSAWRCDRIHFVSETAGRFMSERLRLPERKRAVIHHGIDPAQWRPRRDVPSPGDPYVLSVSTNYRYKNFVRLIEAWTELARRAAVPDLVIIGDDQDDVHQRDMERAREAAGPLAERIHLLGEVPYEDVRRYYAGASLFVFPSYFETFGFPLLEAMASEVPLVASNLAVFREIAGDAAFYADPHDTAALAKAMEEALFAEGAAETLVKRGRERVRSLTWERSAARLLALFYTVIAERQLASRTRGERQRRDAAVAVPEPAALRRDALPL